MDRWRAPRPNEVQLSLVWQWHQRSRLAPARRLRLVERDRVLEIA